MAGKHTPGPWRYVDRALIKADDRCVGIAPAHGITHEVRAANARLIAAAPELLEALKAILALHIAHHNAPGHAAARAAVAKAEGE